VRVRPPALVPAALCQRSGQAIVIVCAVLFLTGSIHCHGRFQHGTVFDLLAIDIELHQPVRPIDLSYRARRDQDPRSGPPVPGIDGDAADVPAGIIHEEIFDITYVAVSGMDMVSGHSRDAACEACLLNISHGGASSGDSETTEIQSSQARDPQMRRSPAACDRSPEPNFHAIRRQPFRSPSHDPSDRTECSNISRPIEQEGSTSLLRSAACSYRVRVEYVTTDHGSVVCPDNTDPTPAALD
jgi:hypothetical protein